MASKWYDLGLELDINPASLDNIEKNKGTDSKACLLEVLKFFLNQSNPTWKKIIEAISSEAIDNGRLAKNLREKYQIEYDLETDTGKISLDGR